MGADVRAQGGGRWAMGGFSDHLSALLGIVVPHVNGVRLIDLQADRRDCVRNLRIAWTLGG